ncbi:MAG: hypothetical protein WCA10_20985 [Terracidiphilus sp.]
MSVPISDWIHTSNDLLRCLMEKHAAVAPNFQIISQSGEDVQNLENASAVTMGHTCSSQGRQIS